MQTALSLLGALLICVAFYTVLALCFVFALWYLGGRHGLGALFSARRARGTPPVVEPVEADPLPSVILRSGFATPVGKLGGQPDLADRHDWPRCEGAPLAFVAQLDLAALYRLGGADWLPDHGALFFFYGVDHSQWGSDPGDPGSWRVIYDAQGFAAASRVSPGGGAYTECPVGGRHFRSIPDAGAIFDASGAGSGGEELGADMVAEGPWHQVGGYPVPLQSDDMALECQLASHGVRIRKAKDYASPEVQALTPGAGDWRLLLQIDSDATTGMTWGDTGMIYFWIREDEARRGDFAGSWMILQCC